VCSIATANGTLSQQIIHVDQKFKKLNLTTNISRAKKKVSTHSFHSLVSILVHIDEVTLIRSGFCAPLMMTHIKMEMGGGRRDEGRMEEEGKK